MKIITRCSAIALSLLLIISSTLAISLTASAADKAGKNKHYLGSLTNAGKDTGYSEDNKITEKDPHFGWSLGNFYVDGYTRYVEKDGNTVFLKTVGDTVTLWFELKQNIYQLNGDDTLSINSDTNGYDEYFGIEKTDFGRGTLIIRHTDYQNHTAAPVIYKDYLAATATQGTAVKVKLCEEGDYEVTLDYEIRKNNLNVFGWTPFPSYYNYRISFSFSVRNGNCMVYPFDVTTGAELTNSSITENGFYLDLANSRYLNIDIKKEVRKEGAEGLTEDVRFNKPAKDGEKYTDEGIYTITVSNLYTNQTTTKVIYVGTDDILKAHVVTGLPINDIEYQLSLGAKVAEDGTLIPAPDNPLPPVEDTNQPENTEPEEIGDISTPVVTPPVEGDDQQNNAPAFGASPFVIGGVLLAAATLAVFVILKRKKNAPKHGMDIEESDDNGGSEE